MYAVFVVDYANVSPLLPSTLNDICRSSLTSEFSPKVYNIALLLQQGVKICNIPILEQKISFKAFLKF